MATMNLLNAFYDAMVFITRKFGIPKPVVMDAATAANKVIHDHLEQQKLEAGEKKNG